MMAEVRALRHNHNLSTDSAIRDVGEALRRSLDPEVFSRALAKLPAEAGEFWQLPVLS